MNGEPTARDRLAHIFDTLDQTSYRLLLHDDQHRRHLLAKLMADSNDPMLREMGQQLRDGSATLSQLLSVPAYWETLERGCDRLADIDLDNLAEQVDELHQKERAEAERGQKQR
jgi:hypothetical protein